MMMKQIAALLAAAFAPLPMQPNLPGLTLCEEQKSAAATALTGTTVETVLATLNIPARLLGNNGEIEVEADFTETNNANAKTVSVRLGGLTGTVLGTLNTNTVTGRSLRGKVAMRNAMNSERARFYTATEAAALTSQAGVNAAIDMSQDQAIVITATLASAGDTITLEKSSFRCYKAF